MSIRQRWIPALFALSCAASLHFSALAQGTPAPQRPSVTESLPPATSLEDSARPTPDEKTERGEPAVRQTVSSNKGELTRLRIGPFDTRQQAEQAAIKAKRLRIDSSVFQQPKK